MAVDAEPGAPLSGVDDDAPDTGVPAPPPSRRGWLSKRVVVGAAALAVLGGVLVFTGGSDDDGAAENAGAQSDEAPEPDAGQPTPNLSGELQEGFVVYADPETGISLQHPQSWVPLARPEQSRRLLLSAGGDSSLMVRVEPIEEVIDTAEELNAVQAVTDRIAGGEDIQVVQRQALEVNGMPGIFYLGRFTDEASGTKVVNAHYFLFKGKTMHVLLFQVAPEEDFERLAPVFDKVLASFQGVPTPPAEEGEPAEAPAEPAE